MKRLGLVQMLRVVLVAVVVLQSGGIAAAKRRQSGGIAARAAAANPVILLHGILDNYKTVATLGRKISRDYPGTATHSIQMYPDAKSLTAIKVQVKTLKEKIQELNIVGPVTLIGHSLGAVTSRSLIQSWLGHNVTVFISIAGPHVGVCKVPFKEGQKNLFPKCGLTCNETIADMAYSEIGQMLSAGNLWNDPVRQDRYLKKNVFLPASLCQTKATCNEFKLAYKKLSKLVLVGGSGDDVIHPWESTLFGYYDSSWGIVKRAEQEFYERLGLEDLDKDGRLIECTVANTTHVGFVFSDEVYEKCIRPHII